MSAPVPASLAEQWLQYLETMPVLPDVPRIIDWVRDQNIIIGPENTTFQGQPYDLSRFPVLATLLTSFFEDPEARELFIEKPVQSTFTATLTFCMAWHMVFHGGNEIFVLHDRDSAREKVKDDVAPILKKIPALGEAAEEAEADSTVGALRYSTGVIRIGSGGTKATLTSIPAVVVGLDECELHPIIDGATSISRARERLTAAIGGGKLVAGSKPEKEAVLVQDDRTRKWKLENTNGAHLDAAYLSGSQLRYECLCPHCQTFTRPVFAHLKFDHCRETPLPGLEKQHLPPLDPARVKNETYWECPHCRGRVHEGAEKETWVRAGRWIATPTAERRGKEIYAIPYPNRWSAQFSALTDIAFESLRWGNIALKFLEAQNNPEVLRAFRNGILGEPEPLQKSTDTTLDQVRRLIARPIAKMENAPSFYVPPWRIKDDEGNLTGLIPMLSNKVHHVAICIDTQDRTFKYSVRAHGRDGTLPLLDYGEWPWSRDCPELVSYLATTRFTTLDGRTCGITTGLIDPKGDHWHDVMELTVSVPLLTSAAGEGKLNVTSRHAGPVWKSEYQRKTGQGRIEYWTHAANHWEDRLYEDCIQRFDPTRYRPWAPALWLPTDVEDRFLEEHTHLVKTWKQGKPLWVKTVSGAQNDWADCSKLHLILDWLLRLRFLQKKAAEEGAKTYTLKNYRGTPSTGKPKPKPRRRIITGPS